MSRWLRDRIELYRLNRRERKLDAEAKRVHKEAEEQKAPQIAFEWESTAYHAYDDIEWQRKKIVSDSLLREADELHVPRPEYGEGGQWDVDRPIMGGYALTREAMVELRAAIRKEKRERREVVEWWVKLIGGLLPILTGLIGALIGLAAVWKHR